MEPRNLTSRRTCTSSRFIWLTTTPWRSTSTAMRRRMRSATSGTWFHRSSLKAWLSPMDAATVEPMRNTKRRPFPANSSSSSERRTGSKKARRKIRMDLGNAFDPAELSPLHPTSPVFKAYTSFQRLIQSAGGTHATDTQFGGKLLFAGELDEEGCSIVMAGNVAGCATLATTADPAAQKHAIRDGIID